MKYFYAFCLVLMVASCGGRKDTTDSFDISRSKGSSSEKPKASEMVALENKGVGPITAINVPEQVDADLAATGRGLFQEHCTICHKIESKFVGPALSGVTKRRSPEWIMNMILNPGRMIRDDSLAKALFMEFNGSPMSDLGLEKSEARALLEYLRTD